MFSRSSGAIVGQGGDSGSTYGKGALLAAHLVDWIEVHSMLDPGIVSEVGGREFERRKGRPNPGGTKVVRDVEIGRTENAASSPTPAPASSRPASAYPVFPRPSDWWLNRLRRISFAGRRARLRARRPAGPQTLPWCLGRRRVASAGLFARNVDVAGAETAA